MNEARGLFADFFARLWRQKPLGIASGTVILILILLAIFADVLAPYRFSWSRRPGWRCGRGCA